MRRGISILLIALLLISAFVPAAIASPGTSLPDMEPLPFNADSDHSGDLDPKLPDEPLPARAAGIMAATEVGAIRPFPVIGYPSGYVLKYFQLAAIGDRGEIWVATNLGFPAGDPRPTPVVTQEQIDYLLGEFDTKMYPKETEFFGPETIRTGADALLPYGYEDGSDRVIILVDNIRDQSFYDPTYPNYIAGYFSSTVGAYTDRNVVTIDCFDWANRVGPDDSPWRGPDPSRWRPYLYEGTFSHEFQHLLHRDHDSDEETWINEGQSTYAEYMLGYSDINDVDDYLWHPYNSLVAWQDQGGLEVLSDYAGAFLFQVYLEQQYGGSEFIQALHMNPLNGIEGVNDTLADFGYQDTFADVVRDWQIALLINSRQPGNGRYMIEGLTKKIDFNYHDPLYTDTDGYPVYDEYEYTGPNALAWGPAYNVIANQPRIERLILNGIDFMQSPWSVVANPLGDGNVLWGGTGSLLDSVLVRAVDLTGLETATLTFDTFYQVEEQWDFAFVQVSTDGGETWTSLANANTRSDVVSEGHPTVVANVPGFTGTNGGWTTEAFDLTPYAGQEILLSFRYVTDWSYEEAGFYVRNIAVPEAGLAIAGDSLDGFMSLSEALKDYVDYMISFVGIKNKGKSKAEYRVINLKMLNFDRSAQEELRKFLRDNSLSQVIMIVTHAAPVGSTDQVPFSYSIESHEQRGSKKH